MPSRKTINEWLKSDARKDFRDQYARAHEEYEDDRFGYLSELREEMLAGRIEPAAFREAFNEIKYELGIRRPKKFNERVRCELTGEDNGPVRVICGWEDEPPDGADGQD